MYRTTTLSGVVTVVLQSVWIFLKSILYFQKTQQFKGPFVLETLFQIQTYKN